MKYKLFLVLTALLLALPMHSFAADTTTKRRPDQAEFVTESHVRLTTESVKIAEVTESTPASQNADSFWDYLTQSFSAFIQSLRDIFRLN